MNKFFSRLTIACLAMAITACGGSSAGSSSSANDNSNPAVSMTVPVLYPIGLNNQASRVPLVIANSGNGAFKNLTYSIINNTTGAAITIDHNNCDNLSATSGNCTVYANVPASAHAGSFTMTATVTGTNIASKFISKIKSLVENTTPVISATIGLTPIAPNQQNGASGITLLYPDTVLGNSTEPTKVIVTAVVASANTGKFNTINLVDHAGNHLDIVPLLGNSGSGLSDLGQYSVVPLLLTIPAGTQQTVFYTQLAKNGSMISTAPADNAETIQIISSAIPTGILNIQPNYTILNSGYSQQTFTLTNSGNGSVNNLSFSLGNNISKLSTTCGTNLAAGSSCSYTIQFDATKPIEGVASVVARYNANSSSNLSYAKATVEYSGNNATAGLKISSSDNLNFIATTANPTQSILVTLTNTGNDVESLVISPLPAIFSLNTDEVADPCQLNTPLAPQQSCNLKLVYTNPAVTAESVATLTANYTYLTTAGIATASSSLTVNYQTNQSYASVAILPKDIEFDPIVNNNQDKTSAEITIQNQGEADASNLSSLITGTAYTIASNNCGNTLTSGSSCSMIVNFGPTNAAPGETAASLAINYSPYAGAAIETSKASWNATILQAGAANPSVNLSESGGFVFGTGTSAFPYHVQQATPASLTYTVSNNSTMTATDFYIVANNISDSGWEIDTAATTCGSAQTPIDLAAGASCKITIDLTTEASGSFDLKLNSLTMSWIDQLHPDRTSAVFDNSTIYATVFPGPTIQITTSQGTPESMGTIVANESFVVTTTLSGGYNVADQIISANINGTAPVTLSPANCTINSNNTSCKIIVTAQSGAQPGNYSLQLANNGTLALPATTVNFEIIKSWQVVGSAGFSAGMAQEAVLKIYNNVPYVAYIDIANESRITVMKFESNLWQPVGNSGFSDPVFFIPRGADNPIDFAIGSNGIPYVAFRDANSGNTRASVMKFAGSVWQTVGTNFVSEANADFLSLALDSNNTPYLAYRDFYYDFKATVMKYTAESWQPVGTPRFSTGQAPNINLAIDANNQLYLSFLNKIGGTTPDYGLVMTFTADNGWQQLGSIESLSTNGSDMVFDSNGTLYIAYSSGYNYFTANVVNFTDNGWRFVGNPGFASIRGDMSLALDSDNALYTTFISNFKINVMKYNGSNWQYLGLPNFSLGEAFYYVSMALDSNNTPYVAYVDYTNGYKATVMSYR